MGKINYKKLYEGRVLEIEHQIKIAINRKDWAKKSLLVKERKELLDKLKIMG